MKYKNQKYFGSFGGRYVPELLIAPLEELELAATYFFKLSSFQREFKELLQEYAGRPTALTEVKRFSAAIHGPRIFLKREDLLHTGAHKINNALGQCLLAKEMGKQEIIAETGAGQHGLATATACAKMGLSCRVYMGKIDVLRQHVNVEKMKLLGAEVISVDAGSQTLKEAINAAMRDWAQTYDKAHYCLGSALGPYPYPSIVIYFHSIIGLEAKKQLLKKIKKQPKAVIACVGGGSNAMGIYQAFLKDKEVSLIGVEAGGEGKKHAARFKGGRPGVLHGFHSYLLQNKEGQVKETHSISAGLDYPAISPALSYYYEEKRIHFEEAKDKEVLKALKLLCQTEGIIPALESSHALAYIIEHAKEYKSDDAVLINLSGRGDKDLDTVFKAKL